MEGIREQLVKKPETQSDKVKTYAVLFGALLLAILVVMIVNIVFGATMILIALLVAGGILYGGYWLTGEFNIEYEYALWYGSFEVAKIYAKKKRKTLVSADVKELLLVAPANEEYLNRAEHFELDKKVFAASSKNAQDLWLLVAGGKDTPHVMVVFEADERLLTMLRQSNPMVFVKK